MLDQIPVELYTIAGIMIGAIILLLIITKGYVKAPPDTALIISGLFRRTVIGKAGILIPFFERIDKLALGLVSIDVRTSSAVPTADFIDITVDAAVNVKISDKKEYLLLAGQNFLNQTPDYIAKIAREVLEGNMREIVGRMTLQEMVTDRQKFALLVQENAEPDLAGMGLDIISFNVQNFTDSNGIISDLGVDNIAQIKKNAAIAKAQAERDVAIAQAAASQAANEARVNAETQIAQQNNELAMRQAELKRDADTKRAAADSAYMIQEQEQRKSIEIASYNADIAGQERAVELKTRAAEVAEQELNASITKKAEADRAARQAEADATLYTRQREADARKYEAEQEAQSLRAKAEAELFAKEQEANAIELQGKAEAEAIRAKLVAEAEGIERKAEAMAKMGQAAMLEMYFNALPEVAKNIAAPLSAVDRITMFGDGNSAKLTGDIIKTLSQVTDGLQESTGLDLKAMLGGMVGAKMTVGNEAKAVQQEPRQAVKPSKSDKTAE